MPKLQLTLACWNYDRTRALLEGRVSVDGVNPVAIPVNNDNVNPLQAGTGRIVLAAPAYTGIPLEDTLYEGWVYAAVATAGGAFGGLYVTKDFGQNWTEIRLPVINPNLPDQTSTNNDTIAANISITGAPTITGRKTANGSHG